MNWCTSRITAHSTPSARNTPHPARTRTARVSEAHRWNDNPNASVLGYATVNASESSPTNPLHAKSRTPHSNTTHSTANGPAARDPPHVRAERHTPDTSTRSAPTAPTRNTFHTDNPDTRASPPSSTVQGE